MSSMFLRALRLSFLASCVCALALAAGPAAADPCVVSDNGSGTVQLPPPGCNYLSPADVHVIIDGLPPGTTIELAPVHRDFVCKAGQPSSVCTFLPAGACEQPGGSLGGNQECASSTLQFTLNGTGLLTGFNRSVQIPVEFETQVGPRTLGDALQSFDTDMFRLSGEITGDRDFDLLRITAGSDFGLPGPGHTTLTQLPGGNWNVDSFFDITYRIDFVGHPGGALGGMSGSTTATIHMQTGEPAPPASPCTVADNGSGTVALPPAGCDYLSPDEVHQILDGLPAGATIELAAIHHDFICNKQGTINPVCSFPPTVDCAQPGGSLGGQQECATSTLDLTLNGTGTLGGFHRAVQVPVAFETEVAPHTPGDAVQSFDTDMFRLSGQITGDPDFDLLRITAGNDYGLPSPGHTTLTQLSGGNWSVDSFFDITYRIDFVGSPGGALGGMSGSTTGTIHMQTGMPPCPGLPAGTDSFPSTGKIVLQTFPSSSGPIVLRLSDVGNGPTVVQRGAQLGDTIDTEIVQLTLSGNHPQLGNVTVRAGAGFGLPPSTGQITGVTQDAQTCELVGGDSFFDVFVRIDVPAVGEQWVNQQPLHVQRHIKRLPPSDEPYENPYLNPVLVVNEADGTPRGQVLYELHHADPPFPPPGSECFDTGLDLLVTVPPLGVIDAPVHLDGPTTVQRGGPMPATPGGCCSGGQSCATDANCAAGDTCCQISAIQTEIVEMQLNGNSPLLGPISVTERPTQTSGGLTQSLQPDRTYAADSFFDVFVDFKGGGGVCNPCTTQGPVHVQGVTGASPFVRNMPPDPNAVYQSQPGQQYQLVNPVGMPVGSIRNVVHHIGPPRDWTPPPPPADDCFDSWITLKIHIFNPFCEETIMVPGGFRILRDAPTNPGGTGNEIIATLMAKGLFSGTSACFGPFTGHVTSGAGQVASLAPAEFFPANSFFDVFFEIETGIGPVHAGPSHMTTTINHLPPDAGEVYYGPGTIIPLFDQGGTQIGEIEEVHHDIHEAVVCPADCWPRILIGAPKSDVQVGIPQGANGMTFDVVRGPLSGVSTLGTATCIAENSTAPISDPSVPPPGQGFYYVARDVFGSYTGTWNSGGPPQVGNRDASITACTP